MKEDFALLRLLILLSTGTFIVAVIVQTCFEVGAERARVTADVLSRRSNSVHTTLLHSETNCATPTASPAVDQPE